MCTQFVNRVKMEEIPSLLPGKANIAGAVGAQSQRNMISATQHVINNINERMVTLNRTLGLLRGQTRTPEIDQQIKSEELAIGCWTQFKQLSERANAEQKASRNATGVNKTMLNYANSHKWVRLMNEFPNGWLNDAGVPEALKTSFREGMLPSFDPPPPKDVIEKVVTAAAPTPGRLATVRIPEIEGLVPEPTSAEYLFLMYILDRHESTCYMCPDRLLYENQANVERMHVIDRIWGESVGENSKPTFGDHVTLFQKSTCIFFLSVISRVVGMVNGQNVIKSIGMLLFDRRTQKCMYVDFTNLVEETDNQIVEKSSAFVNLNDPSDFIPEELPDDAVVPEPTLTEEGDVFTFESVMEDNMNFDDPGTPSTTAAVTTTTTTTTTMRGKYAHDTTHTAMKGNCLILNQLKRDFNDVFVERLGCPMEVLDLTLLMGETQYYLLRARQLSGPAAWNYGLSLGFYIVDAILTCYPAFGVVEEMELTVTHFVKHFVCRVKQSASLFLEEEYSNLIASFRVRESGEKKFHGQDNEIKLAHMPAEELKTKWSRIDAMLDEAKEDFCVNGSNPNAWNNFMLFRYMAYVEFPQKSQCLVPAVNRAHQTRIDLYNGPERVLGWTMPVPKGTTKFPREEWIADLVKVEKKCQAVLRQAVAKQFQFLERSYIHEARMIGS